MDEKNRRDPHQTSQAYIVRLWRRGTDGYWCGSVQDVVTGERHGFATLEQLFAHIREKTDRAADSTRGTPRGPGHKHTGA